MLLLNFRDPFQIYDSILNADVLYVLDIFQWERDSIAGMMRKFKPTV